MFVSIRDEIVLPTGFTSLHEALTFYNLRAVEMVVNKDYSAYAITPTPEQPRLFLDRDADVERMGRQLKGSDLKITAFLLHNDFTSPDLKKELDWVVRIVEVSDQLGIPAVRIDSAMSKQDALPLDQRIDVFAAALTEVLDRTKSSKVALAIENHGAKGNDPAFLDGVIVKAKNRRVGVTLDVGNFYWWGKPLSEVYKIHEHFAKYTKHTHIKNIRFPEEMREKERPIGYEYGKYNCPIPEGDIDMNKVAKFLKKGGYKGDLCIEDESLGKHDVPKRQVVVKATIAYLEAAIRQA
jgi:sugar phosphate isomerase/epimerase